MYSRMIYAIILKNTRKEYKMRKILVTGFDAFGTDTMNPSLEVLRLLPNEINGVKLIKLEIPTIRYQSLKIIEEAIIKDDPDVILSLGQAGGRSAISIERIGINIDDYKIKDNEGNQPVDEIIFEDGKTAYFSNLPIKSILENIKSKGIPAIISNSAGTFVCNHVLYGVQYLIEKRYPLKVAGFIHIPYLPEQVILRPELPSMDLVMIKKAIEQAIITIIHKSSKKEGNM